MGFVVDAAVSGLVVSLAGVPTALNDGLSDEKIGKIDPSMAVAAVCKSRYDPHVVLGVRLCLFRLVGVEVLREYLLELGQKRARFVTNRAGLAAFPIDLGVTLLVVPVGVEHPYDRPVSNLDDSHHSYYLPREGPGMLELYSVDGCDGFAWAEQMTSVFRPCCRILEYAGLLVEAWVFVLLIYTSYCWWLSNVLDRVDL